MGSVAGCGSAWLEHLTGGQETVGSNPATPTWERSSVMQHSTHICVACRQVARDGTYVSCACPICRNPMRNMGTKWEAPKKRDDLAWAKLALSDMVKASGVRLCNCYECTSWRNVPGPKASLAAYKRWLRRRRDHHLQDIPQSQTQKYITKW